MNTQLVTTGIVPICIGSVEVFQHQGFLDGLPWDLTGGSATLTLADPNGNQTVLAASISGGCAFVTWTVAGPAGDWKRAWTLTDASSRHQVSRPIAFSVVSSPI